MTNPNIRLGCLVMVAQRIEIWRIGLTGPIETKVSWSSPVTVLLMILLAGFSLGLPTAQAEDATPKYWASFAGMCHGGAAGSILFIGVSGASEVPGRLKRNRDDHILESARAEIKKRRLDQNCHRPTGPHFKLRTSYFRNRAAALAHAQGRIKACQTNAGNAAGRRCLLFIGFPIKP
jgi:hypothetical protein